MAALLEILPVELIQPILCQLDYTRDLTTAALVCRSFNHAATPLIYRQINARIEGNKVCMPYYNIFKSTPVTEAGYQLISHPSATLLQRPELARYVQHVTETGTTCPNT